MRDLYSVGFDFGTESVRVLIVDIRDGRIVAQAVQSYQHGVIDTALPTGERLPQDYALQDPQDWLDAAAGASRSALLESKIPPSAIVGIGVDFTSCTMLPTLRDGTPLCRLPQFASIPLAWPKLWKHHGAKAETDHMNEVAKKRSEPWLARYGNVIGIEWFFPKILETLNHAPAIYAAAEVWIEAGDWFVWQLTGSPDCSPDNLSRSTCQAGYKALWNRQTGYPSADYFRAVHPQLANVVAEKMPGKLLSPGTSAGKLSDSSAKLFGLNPGTPVSAAIIDAHAGVPGAGIATASTMVLVMGTSSCHMMNSEVEKFADGIAGVVQDGILPGFFGYETGQASVGDAFAWLTQTFNLSHAEMTRKAQSLPPGSNGILALDWLNGCRTPLMDPRLSGAFLGITLTTKPEQLYRALLEATAFGVRWIVETLREAGVPVHHFVASGGLPARSPLLMQIYADVLNEKIALAESEQSCGVGAAILGCLAAGPHITGYTHITQAVQAMARQRTDRLYQPNRANIKKYNEIYALYRSIADPTGPLANAMRQLRKSAT